MFACSYANFTSSCSSTDRFRLYTASFTLSPFSSPEPSIKSFELMSVSDVRMLNVRPP